MFKKSHYVTVFSVLLILFVAGVISCTKKEETVVKKTEEPLINLLNPALSTAFAERAPLAPRNDTLDNKTIYLVDLQWGGPDAGYSVFEEMKEWFAKNMPSVKVEVRRSKGGWMGDDPDLRAEIVANARGAVIGIGG
ncbi:MAG: hypothetical protein JW927_09240 [Deltaproteobacteria bacterium]|nr:hypothetical protein [Deltaproteobacteria bacterium]